MDEREYVESLEKAARLRMQGVSGQIGGIAGMAELGSQKSMQPAEPLGRAIEEAAAIVSRCHELMTALEEKLEGPRPANTENAKEPLCGVADLSRRTRDSLNCLMKRIESVLEMV